MAVVETGLSDRTVLQRSCGLHSLPPSSGFCNNHFLHKLSPALGPLGCGFLHCPLTMSGWIFGRLVRPACVLLGMGMEKFLVPMGVLLGPVLPRVVHVT